MSIQNITKETVGNTNGFSLIELLMVIALISILSAFAIFHFFPMRQKALDSMAISDARNIVDSVINAAMNNEDVDYTKANTGGPVGNVDTGGNPRTPIFTLSPGVMAIIAGGSNQAPNGNNTIFNAIIYHEGGTRQYTCFVNVDTGLTLSPDY